MNLLKTSTFYLLTLLLAFGITSCSDENDTESVYLVSKITYGSYIINGVPASSDNYVYDSMNRISQLNRVQHEASGRYYNKIVTTIKISYSQSKVAALEKKSIYYNDLTPKDPKAEIITTVKFTQTGNEVRIDETIEHTYNHILATLPPIVKNSSGLTIDDLGRIVKYTPEISNPETYYISSYDENGRLVNPYYTHLYDNKNGIFKNINAPHWFLTHLSSESILKYLDYRQDNFVKTEGDEYSFVYEYNEAGYPISIAKKYLDSTYKPDKFITYTKKNIFN